MTLEVFIITQYTQDQHVSNSRIDGRTYEETGIHYRLRQWMHMKSADVLLILQLRNESKSRRGLIGNTKQAHGGSWHLQPTGKLQYPRYSDNIPNHFRNSIKSFLF